MPTGNQYTTAQVPSSAVQILAPDIAVQQTQLARQQRMADILREQSLQQDQGTQVINGWAVKKSPLEGIAKLAQALSAGSLQSKVDDKQLALSRALQQRLTPDAAPKALLQGAAEQPSLPDETGAMVNQGGVGPTVQNAARMDAITSAQPAKNDRFSTQNMMEGLRIGLVGGEDASKAYWANQSATEGEKNDRYLGITPEQSKATELAKRLKEGYIPPTRLGEGAYADSQGNVQGLPTAAPAGYINARGPDGSWTTAPVQGGAEAVQNSEKAKRLGQTLGTLGQGVDASGAPTYFLGVPNGTAGAPGPSQQMQPPPAAIPPQGMRPPGAMPQPSATAQPPAAGPIDLNHMTPEQSKAFMAQAQAQFGLRPGATPGRSVQVPAATPAQSASPAAPASTGGVIRPGNGPGFNEYQQGQAKATSDRRSDLIKQAQDSPARVNVLDNILDLSKAGVATGPTADWDNKFKGIAADTFGIKDWKGEASNYQEIVKFMSQNATRAWQAAGGSGTDAQLSQITKGNVNNGMFPQAVQAMAKYAKAGELALQGMTNAMHAANITDPNSQQRFETTWRQNMDPRIFQLRTMDPAEANAFDANLRKNDPAGYQALMKKAQKLKEMGGL